MVEQRGVEPLTSALRTRRSAKLSYCPTRSAILGSGRDRVKDGRVGLSTHFRASQSNDLLNLIASLAPTLREIRSPTATAIEQRAGFPHQRIHISGRIG